MKRTYLLIMSRLSEQMECQTLLYTTGSSSPLLGIVLRDRDFHQTRQLTPFVIPRRQHSHHNVSYLISLCLPVSITQVMSGIVTPVSAMFVAGISISRDR
jgi:hypothetical protein